MSHNINIHAILSELPNSANKMEAMKLVKRAENAQTNDEKEEVSSLFSKLIQKPSMASVRRALEGNDFSANINIVPVHMRPHTSGGKRSRRTRHKKRTLRKARKTRRHTRRA